MQTKVEQILNDYINHDIIRIPHDVITELKSILKGDNNLIKIAYKILFDKLMDDHSQTRLLSLMVMDVIFQRSKYFRELLVNDLEYFFELTLGINDQFPLPKPKKTAKYLSEQSVQFIQNWVNLFGDKYYRLKLAKKYLRRNHNIYFSDNKDKKEIKIQKEYTKMVNNVHRFVELIPKFNRKHGKIIQILSDFEKKIKRIMPTFAIDKPQYTGFSDDDSDMDNSNERNSYHVCWYMLY